MDETDLILFEMLLEEQGSKLLKGGMAIDNHLFITLPLIDSDGNSIDIFVKVEDGIISLTDMGETFRWMCEKHQSAYLSGAFKKLFQNMADEHEASFLDNVFFYRNVVSKNLVEKAFRLGQLMLEVMISLKINK